MDRNNDTSKKTQPDVALRKESVDRNRCDVAVADQLDGVALRKESVDRNYYFTLPKTLNLLSLSARRAWIEILNAATLRLWAFCRSPQGERG